MELALQQQVADAIHHLDNQKAWEILLMVSKQGGEGLPREDYLRLSYLRMNSLSVDQLTRILEESITVSFTIPDFDLKNKIIEYVELLDYAPAQVEFMQKFKSILEEHEELLGSANLILGNQELSPTIGNWISDFNHNKSVKDRDVLAEMSYLNTAANTKLLDTAQRNILKALLSLYDLLVQYLAFWQNLPENIPESEWNDFEKYLDEKYTSEDLSPEVDIPSTQPDYAEMEPQEVFTPKPRPSAQPSNSSVTPNLQQRRSVDDIQRAPSKPVTYGTQQKSGDASLTSSDSAKIRDLINHAEPKLNDKRGVTMDPTNIKINEEEQRLNQARAQQAASIQNKLAELRKRNSKQ